MTQGPRRPSTFTARTNSRSPSSLGALLEQARDVSARAGGVVIDREAWRRAVGDRIAARTEPGRLRGGVLTLHVASSAWAQELSFFKRELLERVNGLGIAASELRFQVRPNAHSTGATAAPTAAAPTPRLAELPPDLKQRLDAVTDPALRAAIAEAAALGLAGRASSAPRARAPRSAAARSAPPDPASRAAPRGPRRKP